MKVKILFILNSSAISSEPVGINVSLIIIALYFRALLISRRPPFFF
jgi:hypothetical protein